MNKTDLIKELIHASGMNMKEFSEYATIPYTTLRSMLERGIENASVNNVIKICSKLDIPIDSLYRVENEGFWNYAERETIKEQSREIINGNYSTNEKISATINLYKTLYYRSFESSKFNTNHVKLDDFIAMILNQKNTKEYLPSEVYKELVKKYGVKEGIKNGSSYFNCNNLVSKDINTPSIKSYSDDENKLINNYKKLDTTDKNKVIDYTQLLSNQDKYKYSMPNDETSATLLVAEEPEVYNFAAHDDDLTDEQRKSNIEKAKAIFEQMDNE